MNSFPLEQLSVPTLLIHARDDPLVSYQSAADAAERIPGSVLVTLESGGHLGLGQTERIQAAIETSLAKQTAV